MKVLLVCEWFSCTVKSFIYVDTHDTQYPSVHLRAKEKYLIEIKFLASVHV